VDPAWREQGIGGALMEEAVRRAEAAGDTSVLLIGDAEYYARFGFRRDATSRLWLRGPVDRNRFLARELRPQALANARGEVLPLAA
jgi:predicted N-acetyltransferase YhbS